MATTHKNKYHEIQLLYKVIKANRDDLLDRLLKNHPKLAHYSNKKGETIISYALKSKSMNVIKYLLDKHSYLLIQKNRHGEDLLEFLITNDTYENLQFLMNVFDKHQLEKIFYLPRKKPLFILAAQHMDRNFWKSFLDSTHQFITQKDIEYLNEDGLNFLHYLAYHNQEYIEPLKAHIQPEQFFQIDNLTGATPLLMAARYAGKELLLYLLENSEKNQTTFLNSSLTHAATLNQNNKVLETIVEKNLDSIQKDYHQQTPLMLAILNKDAYKAQLLLPQYAQHDISEEILQASRQFMAFKQVFEKNILHLNKEQLLELSQDKEKICAFFSFVFYYCDEKFLAQFSQSTVCDLLKNLQNEPFFAHQVYLSSITGRRAMSKKIKFLQQYLPILHSDETESYYTVSTEGKYLTFEQNITHNEDFSRFQKGFCLVAAMGLLPDGQLKEVLTNSNVLPLLNDADKLLLNSLLITRKNQSLLTFLQPLVPIFDMEKNYLQAIYDFLKKYDMQPATQILYGNIIRSLESFPTEPIHALICSEFKKNPDNLEIFQLLGSQAYHKELYLSICEELFCMDNPSTKITQIFQKNPKFLFFSFKQTLKQRPLDIKLNDFSQSVLNHDDFTHGAHNWKLLLPIAQTSGNEKMMKALLPTIRMANQQDFLIFQQQIENITLTDSAWRCIFNHFSQNPFFPYILNQYLLNISKNDSQSNSNTLLKISEQIAPEHMNTKIWMDNIIQSQNHKDLTILIFENFYLKKHCALDLAKMSFERENISYLRHIINYHGVNINELNLENFWKNHSMCSHFELNIMHKNYVPFDNFIAFIKEHSQALNRDSVNALIQGLLTWLEQTSVDGTTKLGVLYGIFSVLDEHINYIDDLLLLNISNISLQMIDADSLFDKVNNNNVVNYFFNLILNHSDNDFLRLLNENMNQNNSKSKLSEDNQKIMNYYELQAKLNIDKTFHNKKMKI